MLVPVALWIVISGLDDLFITLVGLATRQLSARDSMLTAVTAELAAHLPVKCRHARGRHALSFHRWKLANRLKLPFKRPLTIYRIYVAVACVTSSSMLSTAKAVFTSLPSTLLTRSPINTGMKICNSPNAVWRTQSLSRSGHSPLLRHDADAQPAILISLNSPAHLRLGSPA